MLDRLHPTYAPENTPVECQTPRAFKVGDLVFAQNFGGEPCWLPGQVTHITGPCSYRIQLDDGRTWRRHVDQLSGRTLPQRLISTPGTSLVNQDVHQPLPAPVIIPPSDTPGPKQPSICLPDVSAPAVAPEDPPACPPATEEPAPQPAVPVLRRSSRMHTHPSYLKDYVCTNQG